MPNLPNNPGEMSMLELFRIEAENQIALITSELLTLEQGTPTPEVFEILMRAAHSLKGAARIVNLGAAVNLAHRLEDCFVAGQKGQLRFGQAETDLMLRGVDLLTDLARRPEAQLHRWGEVKAEEVKAFLRDAAALLPGGEPKPAAVVAPAPGGGTGSALAPVAEAADQAHTRSEVPERVVRLGAENLNRLLGLAGESLVESRWLRPFSESLSRLKRQHDGLAHTLDTLRNTLDHERIFDRVESNYKELAHQLKDCEEFLSERMQELDGFDRRSSHLSHRLYLEVLRTRMRPFGEGVVRFPRMVRDVATGLGKQVRLQVEGEVTQVDRDILERLETPLAHLLRNAVDHGCEPPGERTAVGKPAECVIRLEARHSAGMLLVSVTDDGRGVDPGRLRDAIERHRLAPASVIENLSESELLEFLFLPGFSLKETVTEISGRGVGLDVVKDMVKQLRGSMRLINQPGRGLGVQLQLPLTLSVLRGLLVDIAGEPYAVPLTQIIRTLSVPRDSLGMLEGRHHFEYAGQRVGLLSAHQVLECGEVRIPGPNLPVVVIGGRDARYGLVVDRFLGERELVVQPLDPRLGKIRDVSAAALMEDGSPVIILDVDDLLRSIEQLVSEGLIGRTQRTGIDLGPRRLKRILAVDDSLTVREMERKLLSSRGFLTDVAVDGIDAWGAVRSGNYDLVITDVDMPRMDGIELAALIKKDAQLRSTPVMIVSYKDREQDRLRGMEAGADYYLTKGSFHDDTLLQAVVDLIGEPEA